MATLRARLDLAVRCERMTLVLTGDPEVGLFGVLPGIVAGYVPWRICLWQDGAPLLGTSSLRFVGVLLIAAELPILLDSFARFALQGLGTLRQSFQRAI